MRQWRLSGQIRQLTDASRRLNQQCIAVQDQMQQLHANARPMAGAPWPGSGMAIDARLWLLQRHDRLELGRQQAALDEELLRLNVSLTQTRERLQIRQQQLQRLLLKFDLAPDAAMQIDRGD